MKNGQYYSQAKTHDELKASGMEYVNCPSCDGTGTEITSKTAGNCSACYGDGKVWQLAKHDWFCDCSESTIKRVDAEHPHPAIERDGWFCMGCLQEFAPKEDQQLLAAGVRKLIRQLSAPCGGGGCLDAHSQGRIAAETAIRRELRKLLKSPP